MSLPDAPRPRKPKRPPHVCDPEVCGITFDAGCPLWHQPPPRPGSYAWRAALSPRDRKTYEVAAACINRLKELPADARLELFCQARQAAPEVWRELRLDVADVAAEVLAEDLSGALSSLGKGARP